MEALRGIAEQTTPLALNAASEDARVNKQGWGFSVGAAEVRHLAALTRRPTKHTQVLISPPSPCWR